MVVRYATSLKKTVVNQANRLAQESYIDDEDVATLTAEDISKVG